MTLKGFEVLGSYATSEAVALATLSLQVLVGPEHTLFGGERGESVAVAEYASRGSDPRFLLPIPTGGLGPRRFDLRFVCLQDFQSFLGQRGHRVSPA